MTNAGTISTPFIGFGSGNDTLVLQRGSVINGSVNGGLGENTLILEGASLTNATQFSNFGDRVTVRGTGSSIDGDFAFNQITVQGGLLVTRTLTSPVSLATGGHLQVGAEGQTGARVLGAVNIAGGTLSGHGSITGAVSNTGGTVAPGGSIGTLAKASLRPIDELSSEYYLNLEVKDQPGVLSAVAGIFGKHGVSIRSMEQEGLGDEARLIFITHTARERDVQATLHDLGELDVVDRIGSVLRVVGDA